MSQDRVQGNGVAGLVDRFIPLRRLGWAFLLAWVFCIFYTGVVEGYSGGVDWVGSDESLLLNILMGIMPVSMSIAMLVVIVGGEKRFGSPVEHPSVFWLAPMLTAISTPMLFWSWGDVGLSTVLYILGALCTGVGSGLMWVMWGEYYARISQETVEQLAPLSAIIAALLVLVLSAMSGWVALVMVMVFPLLSGLCFYLAWKDVENESGIDAMRSSDKKALDFAHGQARNRPFQAVRDMGRTGLGIFAACLFVCLAGSLWTGEKTNSFAFQIVLLVSMLFMALITFASTVGPRRITISFLYRWMCPALVLAFVALIVFEPEVGEYLAYTVSIAARFAFCLITQMYFARYAAQGRATAVQSFGLGWLFVHLGDCLGFVIYFVVSAEMAVGAMGLHQVAAVAIGILVVITMYVLNDKKSFAAEVIEAGEIPQIAQGEVKSDDVSDAEEIDALKNRVESLAAEYELTPRETEVLDLLARGRSVPYVRDALFISKETAATHVKHIYAKLDVHSRQELIDLVD